MILRIFEVPRYFTFKALKIETRNIDSISSRPLAYPRFSLYDLSAVKPIVETLAKACFVEVTHGCSYSSGQRNDDHSRWKVLETFFKKSW